MEVLLYNSTVCRLCGEENDSGTLLYSCEENSQNLSEVINTYLPIKVSDDGVLPRTICPGCTIQLEATVEFFNLIISGQKVIRELHQREKEYKKSLQKEPENILTEKIVYEINTSDGVYTIEHPIALQVAGLERPKRKRGRPPKKPKTPQEIAEEAAVRERELKEKEESKKEDVSGKRRRKTPTRFKGAVQGKELERIFKEEGVTEGSESEAETRAEPPQGAVPREPEVIGHLAASGELVVLVRGKGRGRPKGRMRQTKHECAICGMEFSSVGRYMSHVAQHGPVLFQCAACEKSFEAMLEFRAHQMETGHTGRKVMPCSTATNGEVKLENVIPSHQKPDVTGQAEGVEGVNISLPYCTLKPEDNLNSLPPGPDSAVEVNKNEVQTDVESNIDVAVVDETDPLAEAAEQPETSGANTKEKVKLKCNHCDKLFSSKQSKSMHIKAVHQGEKPYVCVECGCRFAYPRSLALHHVSHRRRARPRRYACDLCPKVLNHPSSVVYHKEAEHAGQCYVCNKCGKSFKHKQLLRRHQLVHTQARPFECTQCNATFKTKANLMNHQLLHSGVKKFTCEICKYKFAHKTSLTLHMRWHTGSKPYVCNVCGKGFSQKGNLSEHERIHTGEKPFVCNQCGRRFTTSSQYRLHARRHQPDKTYYACQHCPKKFATHCGWLAHRRKEISRREHVCATCGRAFAERWALHKHSRKHTGERPFRCPHCPRTFADCSNLNKHKKFVHRQISLLVNDKDQAMQQPLLLQQEQLLEQQPTDDALDPDAHGSVIVMDSMDTMDSVQQELLEQQSEEDAQIDPDGGVIVMNSMDTMDSVQEQDTDAERVIYVAYDVDEPESTFHIIDPEQAAAIDSGVVTSCSLFPRVLASPEPEEAPAELAQPREVTALTAQMTDEQGNPLLFTMSDGTRLAITSNDGKSLQVVTQDGQTIPVQINGYPEEEEVDSLPSTVQLELDSAATEAAVTHYFTIVE